MWTREVLADVPAPQVRGGRWAAPKSTKGALPNLQTNWITAGMIDVGSSEHGDLGMRWVARLAMPRQAGQMCFSMMTFSMPDALSHNSRFCSKRRLEKR